MEQNCVFFFLEIILLRNAADGLKNHFHCCHSMILCLICVHSLSKNRLNTYYKMCTVLGI